MEPPIDRTTLEAALHMSGAPSSDFDLNPDFSDAVTGDLRAAGVLIPIMDHPRGPRLVLTKRSSALKHHPGQIAFPGGRVDPTDLDPIDAALRESEEEIGLPRQIVDVIGTLPTHETVTRFQIYPVLGWIRDDFVPIAEPGEVSEIFTVPMNHVLNVDNFNVQSRLWRGQKRSFFTVPYGPYYIWGATARILRGLADRVQL